MAVIKGSLPQGLPRVAAGRAAQPFAARATPSWVQARIGAHGMPQAAQPTSAQPRVAQPQARAHANAARLPQHMAPHVAQAVGAVQAKMPAGRMIVQRSATTSGGGGTGGSGGGFSFNIKAKPFVMAKPKGPTITKAVNYIGNADDYEPCKTILEQVFAGEDLHLEITNGLHSSFHGDIGGQGPGMYEYFDYIVSGNAVVKYHYYTRKL